MGITEDTLRSRETAQENIKKTQQHVETEAAKTSHIDPKTLQMMDAIKAAIWNQRGEKLIIRPHPDPTKMDVAGGIDCEALGRAVVQHLGLKENPATPREGPLIIEEA
jgi:hypothetical protein